MENQLLQIKEVALALGWTYRRAYRLVRSGAIPARRIGLRYWVSRRTLLEYLDPDGLAHMERAAREAREAFGVEVDE